MIFFSRRVLRTAADSVDCCTIIKCRGSIICVEVKVFVIDGSYGSLGHLLREGSRTSTSVYMSLSIIFTSYMSIYAPPYTGSVTGNGTSGVGSTGNDTFAVGITGNDTFPVGITGTVTFKVGVTGMPTGVLVISGAGFPPKSHG
jgi:hypothetical protein